MAKLKDGFYKQTAEDIGSDLYVLLAGGGSKALSDFAYKSDLTNFVTGGPYLPLSGGTMTGPITMNVGTGIQMKYDRATDGNPWMYANGADAYGIRYFEGDPDKMVFSASGNAKTPASADLCINGNGEGTVTIRGNNICHAGNIGSYALTSLPSHTHAYLPFNTVTNPTNTISLNDYVNHTGMWMVNWAYANAPYVNNQPWGNGASSAATMVSLPGLYPIQLCRFYNSNDIYIRGYYSGTGWTSWQQLATTAHIPTVTNYYWANVPISDTSNSGTSPTFANATTTELLTVSTGGSHCGIKAGSTYINSISGDLIFQNNGAIRFGGDSWDYDVWAGLKYVHSSKTIYLGLADNSAFTANSAQSVGNIVFSGIDNMSLSGYIVKRAVVEQHTNNAAGWYRIATLKGYFNVDVYTSGGWSTGMPSVARYNCSQINGTPKIIQVGGYIGNHSSSVRLGRISTDEYELLVYITNVSGATCAQQNYVLSGIGDVTTYYVKSPSTTSYAATYDLSLATLSGRVLTTDQYSDTLDTRYYTETEADDRFVNATGDTMSGVLTMNTGTGIQMKYTTNGNDPWIYPNGAQNFGIRYFEGNPDKMALSASGNNNTVAGADLCINGNGDGTVTIRGNTIWHAGNDGSGSGLDADKVDGYHASSLWRSDGGVWNPTANITLGATANSQEWSFDITRNGYTGCYWHVRDSQLGTMLRVNADDGKVSAPYGFVGNLAGTASSVTVSNSDHNSTYRIVWHSGNSLYGTGGIYCNPSTDYLYATSMNASDWFRSSGNTGWHNPTNGCHVYPNATTTYGGLMLRGEKGGYTGFILGTSTSYMNLMDNGTDKGLYQEGKGWILYYNRSNNYVGIRTSSLSDPVTISGITRVVASDKYLRIGPQNSSHAHYETNASVSHWFNKAVQVDGNVEPYGNNEHSSGSSSNRWSNVYSYLGNFAGTVTISCAYPNIVCNASSGSESNIRFDVGGVNKGYVGFHNSYGTFLYNSTAGKYVYVNNNGYFYTQSYINVGAGNEKNASNPPYVWGVNGSDNFMRTYATSSLRVANADTVDDMHASQFIHRLPWWTSGNGNNIDNVYNGTTFAYTNHNAPTNGVFVAFSGTHNSHQLQLQGQYNGQNLYFRNKNGDSGTWNTWRYVIHSGNIGSQSVNYATTAGNADTLDGINSTGFLRQVVVPNNTENDFNTFSNMTLTGRGDPTTGASLKNAPWSGQGPVGGYGVLTYLWSGYGTQMAWGYNSNRIYIRPKYYSSGSVWASTWDSLALSSDLSSYFLKSGGDITGKTAIIGQSVGSSSISSDLDALVIATKQIRSTTAIHYYPGIAFNHLWNYDASNTYQNSPQAWIGLRLHSTSGSELSYLVFATKSGTGTFDRPVERISIAPGGNVGIGTYDPTQKLSVNGAIYTMQPSTNRQAGIIGTYDPNRAAAIWSMGADYQIAADGTTFGNLYGAAYAYFGSGYTFGANYSLSHSFVWCQNGTPFAALGNNIWTNGSLIADCDGYGTVKIYGTSGGSRMIEDLGTTNGFYIKTSASWGMTLKVNTNEVVIGNGTKAMYTNQALDLGTSSKPWGNIYGTLKGDADTVDGYHIQVVSSLPASRTNNTIYIVI